MVLYCVKHHHVDLAICHSELYYRSRQDHSPDRSEQEKAENKIKMAGANGADAGTTKET